MSFIQSTEAIEFEAIQANDVLIGTLEDDHSFVFRKSIATRKTWNLKNINVY